MAVSMLAAAVGGAFRPPSAEQVMKMAQAQQHMHSLQLDWLARAGLYLPRVLDYNGESTAPIDILHL